MPELPEVRTVASTLKNNILNQKITKIKIIYAKILDPNSLDFNLLINQEFLDIKTRGKYLLFELNDYYLVSHLRMEGKYNLKNIHDGLAKHEHLIIEMGDLSLRYHDTRKFGRMRLIKKDELDTVKGLKKLGYEPFDQNMNKEYLYQKLNNKNKAIKSLLLDQTIINGLGNIYADEVLFKSKINPLKSGSQLSLKDCNNLITNSIDILSSAIKLGGTTIKSYTSSLGVTGQYQNYLLVHKKEKEPCIVCQTPIKKIKVNGRSTYFCPQCQK